MHNLIGREYECERLDKCLNERQAQLIIVYGRRRVGKTFLIHSYFDGRFDFKLSGAYGQPRELQLKHFTAELNRQSGLKHSVPKDWTDAFELLRAYLESLPKEEKRTVFIDEMPWLDTQGSDFLPAFEWFWNDWGSMQENLIFIVCGSAASWMTEHIAQNKGGLFSRQSCSLYLMPFDLRETELYLISHDIHWSRYEIAECYMIMGGIPYYLSLLDPSLSCRQNIDRLFFRKRAELWDEFDHLYRTLFTNSDQYIRLVETLSSKRSGMTRGEIATAMRIPANGYLTKMLKSLNDSGFIRENAFYGKKRRDTLYQLADYYTLFYYRFIKDRPSKDERFWSNSLDNPSRRTWEGLTFELLCRDHIKQIKKKLDIYGVYAEESIWYAKPEEINGIEKRGAQIDLLIERRDRVINLCEIKFSLHEFEIDKSYDDSLRNKIERFRQAIGPRDTIALTMITTFGVKNNKYSGLVSNQVILDNLFAQI